MSSELPGFELGVIICRGAAHSELFVEPHAVRITRILIGHSNLPSSAGRIPCRLRSVGIVSQHEETVVVHSVNNPGNTRSLDIRRYIYEQRPAPAIPELPKYIWNARNNCEKYCNPSQLPVLTDKHAIVSDHQLARHPGVSKRHAPCAPCVGRKTRAIGSISLSAACRLLHCSACHLLTLGCRVDRQVSTVTCSRRPRRTSFSFPSAKMAPMAPAACAFPNPDHGRRFRPYDGDFGAARRMVVVSNPDGRRRASTLSLGCPGLVRHRSDRSAFSYMAHGGASCGREISNTPSGASSIRAPSNCWYCGSSCRNACSVRARTAEGTQWRWGRT